MAERGERAQSQYLPVSVSSLLPAPPYSMEDPTVWDNFWITHPNSQEHTGAHLLVQFVLMLTLGVLAWDQDPGAPKCLWA